MSSKSETLNRRLDQRIFYTGTHAIRAWFRPDETLELRLATTDSEGTITSEWCAPTQKNWHKDRAEWMEEIIRQFFRKEPLQ
jgi:hypothetical protein